MTQPEGKGLSRAKLLIKQPPAHLGAAPGGTIAELSFQFNPNELRLTKRASWNRKPIRDAQEAAQAQFDGSEPSQLSVELFLDATERHDGSVERAVQNLLRACVPTPQSLNDHKPAAPWVRFEWGTARTVSFDGIVTSVSVTYVLFDVDGQPLRARCAVDIEEAGGTTLNQNPTSGALEARRSQQIVAGDTLPHVAWRAYGDATAWRAIAEANDLDDPLDLTPGAELLIPAPDAATGRR
jgi:nucleoid-associated protein YgaU